MSYRKKWDSEASKLKEVYESELSEARRILNDTAKDCAAIDLRAKRVEDENRKLQER